MSPLRVFYDCKRCPAYCCTYSRIAISAYDIARLAKRFGITPAQASRRFTVKGNQPGERILRHQADEVFGTACTFLDLETRRCTVYEHRPHVCRSYPGGARCGYYDFLSFERRAQGDEGVVIHATVEIT